MKWNPASHWDTHPDFPVEDWRAEIANGDTRQSYIEWVNNQLEMTAEEGSAHSLVHRYVRKLIKDGLLQPGEEIHIIAVSHEEYQLATPGSQPTNYTL